MATRDYDAIVAKLEQQNDMTDLLPPVEAYQDEPTRNGQYARENSTPEPFAIQRLDQVILHTRHSVVQGLGLDDGTVVAVVGVPNGGKTGLSVSLGIAAASRLERWLNLKLAGGPVVYFAAEAPASVKMRARAAVQCMELNRAPAFYVCDAVPAIGGELTAAYDAVRIIATIKAVESVEGERVCLTFLDTLASCLGDGDENGPGMLRLVAAAKKVATATQTCVVLVHHPAKGDSASLRGHGSLAAACDSIIRIEVEELTQIRTATLVKARDHVTGLQLRFELEPVVIQERDNFGDPYTTIVVRTTSALAPRPRPGGRQQQTLLAELERRYRTGDRQWDEATIRKAGRDLAMPRSSPADALKGLMKAGYVIGAPGNLTLKFPPDECTK